MPYLEQMLREAQNLDLSKPGVFVAEVSHDDWCNLLKGKGPCNCNPDVKIDNGEKSG